MIFPLNNVSKAEGSVNQFLINSVPDKCQRFSFNYTGDMVRSEDYLAGLKVGLQNVLYMVYILYTHVQAHHFSKIVESARNCQVLRFKNCTITSVSNSSTRKKTYLSNIKHLRFSGVGLPEYGDWKNKPERFVNLVKEISNNDSLLKGLDLIEFHDCCVPESMIVNTFIKYGILSVGLLVF